MNLVEAELPVSPTKVADVRSVFENVSHYVTSRRVDIDVRIHTVNTFAKIIAWKRLLDVGCGDGSISLPLVSSQSQLTLLDLSSNMTKTATSRIPPEFASNVEVRNENFMTSNLDPDAFDLILAVGVLAHVDSPDQFISKIKKLLRPGRCAIVEFTDSHHFVGRLARATGWIKEIFAPAKYQTNRLSMKKMRLVFACHGLRLISVFRYSTIPIPLVERIVPPELLVKFVRFVFGRPGNNRNGRLGNEYICLLTSE